MVRKTDQCRSVSSHFSPAFAVVRGKAEKTGQEACPTGLSRVRTVSRVGRRKRLPHRSLLLSASPRLRVEVFSPAVFHQLVTARCARTFLASGEELRAAWPWWY